MSRPFSQAPVWQIVRFGLVGAFATVVHATSGYIAVSIFGFGGLQANVIGFLFAWWVSFFGHHRFTFGAQSNQREAFFRFVLHSIVLFGIGMAVTSLISIEVPMLPQSLLPVVGAIIVAVASLISSKFFVFKVS